LQNWSRAEADARAGAEQGSSTRRKLDPRDCQGRILLDYRLVQRNQSPPPSQNRYVDSDGTVYPGDPARDRASNSGPFTDNSFRERYDNSRDKSMGSDRSHNSRPREAATESIEPYMNRDPRVRDAQQGRSYPNFRTKSPTRGRGSKEKGARASSTASAFPTFQSVPIPILTRSQALRHLKIEKPLSPPTESEATGITDDDLADLLRKPTLAPNDRANHEIICAQLREMYVEHMIGIEMYHDRNEPTTWVNILGETIPPERVGDIKLR
jgi:hypothetical protein